MTQTILFLAASPSGMGRLSLDVEARAIQRELERARRRDAFELVTRWAAEPLDLLHELRTLSPSVVHFSGHGGHGARDSDKAAAGDAGARDVALADGDDPGSSYFQGSDGDEPGGLYFQGPDGHARRVSSAALADAFGTAGASVKLVVLSACYSESHAEALLAHVDCVVGMRGSILDEAARSFAIGFYGGLGGRHSVAAAFRQGCTAVRLEGLRDADRPQLKVRAGIDADRLILSAAARPRRVPAAWIAVGALATSGLAVLALAARDVGPPGPGRAAPQPPRAPVLAESTVARDPAPPPELPDMVAFPEAVFEMGSTPEEIDAARAACVRDAQLAGKRRKCATEKFEREGPVRTVTLSQFAIDRTEVTNASFAGWLSGVASTAVERGDDGRYVMLGDVAQINLDRSELEVVEMPRGGRPFRPRPMAERHPVAGVSRLAARAYCTAQHKRLPTEAEWEYAARGSSRRRFPWGDAPEPAQLGCALVIGSVADQRCPDPRDVVDVGSTLADTTPEGVRDLGGNVAEWVDDTYTITARYPDCGRCRDPRVTGGPDQVFRGSSHLLDASAARGAARSRSDARAPAAAIGFRCASSR